MNKQKYTILLPVMAGAMIFAQLISNVMSSIVPPFGIGPFVLSGGFYTFPIVYVCSDLVQEVYGYRVSRRLSWLMGLLAAVASIIFFVGWKTTPNDAIAALGAASWIITIAGIVATQAGSYVNDTVFSFLLEKPRLFRFWISSLAGEVVDSTIFVIVGLNLVFHLPGHVIAVNICSQIIFKMAVEMIWSPASVLLAPAACKFEGVLPARNRPEDAHKFSLFG